MINVLKIELTCTPQSKLISSMMCHDATMEHGPQPTRSQNVYLFYIKKEKKKKEKRCTYNSPLIIMLWKLKSPQNKWQASKQEGTANQCHLPWCLKGHTCLPVTTPKILTSFPIESFPCLFLFLPFIRHPLRLSPLLPALLYANRSLSISLFLFLSAQIVHSKVLLLSFPSSFS